MSTVKAVLNPNQYVQVAIGGKPLLLQSLRDTVQIVFSDTQPVVGNGVYHMLNGGDQPLLVENNDLPVWAYAKTLTAALIITTGELLSGSGGGGTSVRDQDLGAVLTYTSNGDIETITYDNGVVRTFTYNSNNELISWSYS